MKLSSLLFAPLNCVGSNWLLQLLFRCGVPQVSGDPIGADWLPANMRENFTNSLHGLRAQEKFDEGSQGRDIR